MTLRILAAAPPASTSVSISTTRTIDKVTPDPIVFEAAPTGFTLPALPAGATQWRPAEHRLLYKWTFTDSGRTWSYFRSPFAEWEQHDVRYGPKVTQMVFDPNSDFTATVEVWGPGGEYATASTTILAADFVDPEVLFAGTDTIIVDPSGVGDPSRPSATVVTTADLAFTVANENKRKLLKRGETFTASWGTYNIDGEDRFYVGDWGTGAKPVLTWTGGAGPIDRMFLFHQNSANPPRLVNIDIVGNGGDITADLSTSLVTTPKTVISIQSEEEVIICGCRISNHDAVRSNHSVATPDNCHVVFWDTQITKWWDYGSIMGIAGGRLSIVGCDWSQDPAIDSGGPKFKESEGQLYANHGPTRFSAFNSLYLDCVSFASLNGWAASGDYTDIQPALRATELEVGASVFISRVASEGPIALANTSGSLDNFPLNAVLDKVVVLQTGTEGNSGKPFGIERTGVTVRNGLVISDNVPSLYFSSDSPYGPQVSIENRSVMAGTSQFEPIEIYGLTLIDRFTTANNLVSTSRINDTLDFDNVSVSGVITHAPAKDTPDTPFAPMTEGAALGFQSIWDGFAYRPGARRWNLIATIDASQTTGIIINSDISRKFTIEGTVTLHLGTVETGEQITATGITPNGGNYELKGVTRGANGTTAASLTAGSENVWSGYIPRLTAYAGTANFAKVWTPATGSSALGGATGDALKPLDDIRGITRVGVTAVDDGAFQVSV